MNEIIDNFKKVFITNFANFEGRARRSEFWLFHLVLQLLYLVFLIPVMIFAVFMIVGTMKSTMMQGGASVGILVLFGILLIALLAIFIPILAVTARRLHDTNRSGWWMLLGFVPFGTIIVLYFLVLDGDENENEYGADPKEEERNYYRSLASQNSTPPAPESQQGYVQNY